MKKIIFLLFLATQFLIAQQEDALVFFADKENVAASIANPLLILTQEAIDRKVMHNVPVDERDVPVNENYIATLKAQPGIQVLAKTKWLNAVYVRGNQSDIEDLENLSFVVGVEFMNKDLNLFPVPNPIGDKFAMENSESKINYDYGAAATQTEMLSIDFVHQQDYTGQGMVVAVLDAGFPNVTTIPAFANMIAENRLLATYDFVLRQEQIGGSSTHGTKVLSDMAALLDGVFVGTAPGASYYLFRTEDTATESPVEEAYWVEALERADSLGVDVVNTSLGYQDFDNPNYDHSYEDLDGRTTISARGANAAYDKGMLVVTSAGNDGGGFTYVGSPGDALGIFTIGAVDSAGDYAPFSSIGPTVDGRIKPDVMAQGANAAVIDQNGDVVFNSGTSFSSPIMAGAITSLWQSRPDARNFQIMHLLRESASLYPDHTYQMGFGIPNFEDAFNALQILGRQDDLFENQFAVYPNPVNEILNVSFPETVSSAIITLYNILGDEVKTQQISTSENFVNVSDLNSGLYIAQVTGNGKTNSFKIIKL